MRIKYHRNFAKNYKKRISRYPKLVIQFNNQVKKFARNPRLPLLRDHRLSGKKSDYRAFSITGDIRIVYKIVDNEIWFYDIGSYNQVY